MTEPRDLTHEADLYHVGLHQEIMSCRPLAEWIFYDIIYNCDQLAIPRSTERLNAIRAQHGDKSLFGIAAWWATRAVFRMQTAMRAKGQDVPSLQSVISDRAQTSPSELEPGERAVLSGTQFFVLVANDDLETAEAIFNAATSASDEDMFALLQAVLNMSINVSGQASGGNLT